ncbi:MAG TPA: hypothetical protein VK814_11890 [Acidobacteriaceae bacterium]|jgi:hypothetical protein|nr:hypothetical protein [Acidobacteriaceae bacterium]
MTERAFRQRFVQLWGGFTVVAFAVSRVLFMSGMGLEWQKLIYGTIWLGTVVAALVLYRRGSVTDHAEREQILAKAELENRGRFGFFNSMLALGAGSGFGMGIWDARGESLAVASGLFGASPFNLGLMIVPFLRIRNAHLRRMQETG